MFSRLKILIPDKEEARKLLFEFWKYLLLLVLAAIGLLVPAARTWMLARIADFWTFSKRDVSVHGWIIDILAVCAVFTAYRLFCWAASFLRAAHVRQYKQGDFNGIHWTWRWKKGRVNQSTMGGFCPTCQTEFIITPRPNQYGGTDTTIFCTHCNSGFGIYNVANLHDHIARKIEGDIRSGRWKTIAKT